MLCCRSLERQEAKTKLILSILLQNSHFENPQAHPQELGEDDETGAEGDPQEKIVYPGT